MLTPLIPLVLPLLLAAGDPVFDLSEINQPSLEAKVLNRRLVDGIVREEVQFFSHRDGIKRIDVFAIVMFPEMKTPLPAIVWNQGGLAQASDHWPLILAKRGYVAISIDFPMPGYRTTGGSSIVSGLELPADPKHAPIYHGAVALLRAVTYLESRPEVDRTRIGMAGTSWGGFYTSLMSGIDPRIQVGSAKFGAGNLHMGNTWWDGHSPIASITPTHRQRWQDTLDPALRLRQRAVPMHWVTGTNDRFYWLHSVDASARESQGPTHLALLPNFDHALTPELSEQSLVWLDIHLKGKPPLVKVTPLKLTTETITWTVTGPRKAARAELIIGLGKPGNWVHRPWLIQAATLRDGVVTIPRPRLNLPIVVSGTIIDSDGFRSSTPLLEIPADAMGTTPIFDGCGEWGDLEPEQKRYVDLHAYPWPTTITPGFNSATAGRIQKSIVMEPVQFVMNRPHRLSLMLKGTAPKPITVRLSGHADGKPLTVEKSIQPTADWQAITLDLTPPEAIGYRLQFFLDLPPGSDITFDRVQFRLHEKAS